MSRPRYIAWILPHPGWKSPEIDDAIKRAQRLLGPDARMISSGRLRMVTGCPVVTSVTSEGEVILLGQVFSGLGDTSLATLKSLACDAVLKSAGASLVREFWGGYVAFVVRGEGSEISVIREPSACMPCYYHLQDRVTVISSDIDIASQCGALPLYIDWEELAVHLQASQLRRARTCIRGLTELLGGERLSIHAEHPAIDALWSPWTFSARDRQIFDEEQAASLLRKTIVQCVRSLTLPYEHMVLTLSGGLDSSIVAASLSTIGARFTGLTMATQEPLGDERRYAQAMARACGAPLVERFEDIDSVDLTRCDSAHLPRPISRGFAQSIDRACQQLADEVGAGAYLGGGGGDNVFCYLLSAAPAADHLRRGEPLAALVTARDLARLGQTSVLHVLGKAMRRAWLRSPGFRWPRDLTFLSERIRNSSPARLDHPWLVAPRGAAPGKAGHIASIMNIQNHLEGLARERDRPIISPLLAQPVVELCLRIPASLWCRGGRDRWIARRAFADRLPPEILDRREKGGPDGFVMRVLERDRGRIRDWLCQGELARRGLLDIEALAAALDGNAPLTGQASLRILKLLDVEMWARSVLSRQQSAT
ncbi:asparagine synthase-related protein [Novosphingobium malaysiense]|uniref:asparagine synthase (glutamine-hydrolyzing) n=1 Tax=Novosphingobium malaysiense TaxID=1348853 RepID=A0A0B1ZCZ9_9SPHN|nr:asparagine synthase C-terminal domain-containing protein [Novosphingobium malaysiense]KHK88934.1 hypothetical protein LK12_22740 [Novosphingobium malaysiense]